MNQQFHQIVHILRTQIYHFFYIKMQLIRDKEKNNFFGGVLTVLIASVAGEALASERITFTKDSLYLIR